MPSSSRWPPRLPGLLALASSPRRPKRCPREGLASTLSRSHPGAGARVRRANRPSSRGRTCPGRALTPFLLGLRWPRRLLLLVRLRLATRLLRLLLRLLRLLLLLLLLLPRRCPGPSRRSPEAGGRARCAKRPNDFLSSCCFSLGPRSTISLAGGGVDGGSGPACGGGVGGGVGVHPCRLDRSEPVPDPFDSAAAAAALAFSSACSLEIKVCTSLSISPIMATAERSLSLAIPNRAMMPGRLRNA